MEDYRHSSRPKRRFSEDDEDVHQSGRHLPGEGGAGAVAPPRRPTGTQGGKCLSESQHRELVLALWETGLKHASPSVIMEGMSLSQPAITSERVKSHLQKYRNNKEKNKEAFLQEYDSFLQKALTVGAASSKLNQSQGGVSFLSPEELVRMLGSDTIIGGDLPALLTYAVMHEDGLQAPRQAQPNFVLSYPNQPLDESTLPQNLSIEAIKSGSQEYTNFVTKQEGTKIPFPILSEEERNSPLGVSIGHVMALFCSMTQQIIAERAKRGEAAALSPPSSEFREVEPGDVDTRH